MWYGMVSQKAVNAVCGSGSQIAVKAISGNVDVSWKSVNAVSLSYSDFESEGSE